MPTLRSLAAAPVTLPAMLAVTVFLIWAGTEGGQPASHWYPGALFLLGLLTATAFVLPGRIRALPLPVRVAAACLVAFTFWSYLAITWADAQGEAWDAANRTLLYLAVFALFALWPQEAPSAAFVLGAWVLGITGIAVATLIGVTGAADPAGAFISGRLSDPAGYPNAAAATFLMAFFPAIVLAGRREVPAWLRGIFAGAAVVLADVALLSQSRGSIYAMPILLIVFFAAVPGRVRSFAVLLAVAGAVALTVPGVLDVADRLRDSELATHGLSDVARPIILAALAVAALVTLVTLLDGARRVSPQLERRVHRGLSGLAIAGALAGAVVGLALAGNPVTLLGDGWDSFKRGYPETVTGSRLEGLGSNRYDFYRVALNSFGASPIAGKGGDNFAQDYLRHGRSTETPRYPHSLELRTLSQYGIVGALLLLGAIGGILAGVGGAIRRAEPFPAAVVGAAGMVFAYWLVHGSVDWFFEFAGLGAPAFAMAGLACSLAPRPESDADAEPRALLEGWTLAAGFGTAAVLALSLALPWMAERDVLRAARTWPDGPDKAYERLDRAADLNPVSPRPQLIAGSIALRLGDLPRAERAFAGAINRDPRSAYAYLELGAIASQLGDRRQAEDRLARAVELSPRDMLARNALARVRRGRRIDVDSLNRQILTRARKLVR